MFLKCSKNAGCKISGKFNFPPPPPTPTPLHLSPPPQPSDPSMLIPLGTSRGRRNGVSLLNPACDLRAGGAAVLDRRTKWSAPRKPRAASREGLRRPSAIPLTLRTHLPLFQSLNFHNFSGFFTPPKYCNFNGNSRLLEPHLDLSQPRPHFEVFFSCPRCVPRGTPARKLKPLPRKLPNLKSKLSTPSKSYLFCVPNFTFLPSSISMVDNFDFLMIFLPKRTSTSIQNAFKIY